MKVEPVVLLIIAALHLAAQATHNYAHIVAEVRNTLPELLFIAVVITITPWAAILVAWKRSVRKGAAVFALSMVAAFLFGYLLHFVIDSPDLHSNVVDEHRPVFFHSALSLALLEFTGFAFGAYVFLRSPK